MVGKNNGCRLGPLPNLGKKFVPQQGTGADSLKIEPRMKGKYMFEQFDICQKQLIFQALKRMVESASGIGFHNMDQGNEIYWSGANGNVYEFPSDGPEKSDIFKMLSELSRDFKANGQTGYVWWYDFSKWQDFCKFAYEASKAGDIRS